VAIEKGDAEWDAKVREVFAQLKAGRHAEQAVAEMDRRRYQPMTAFPTPPQPPQPVAESRLQRLFGFRTRLYLTWAAMFSLFAGFFLSFDLKFSIILDKLPNLLGVHLAPNGFLQGAALTLFLCLCSIVASSAGLHHRPGAPVEKRRGVRHRQFLRLVLSRHAAADPDPADLPGPAATGRRAGRIVAGIIALSLNYGAYLSEIFRAGILGVPTANAKLAGAGHARA
jgi:polar amino acid transport system permease protein